MYLIESLNHMSWRKAVQRVLAFNAGIVVIPWCTAYWAPCFGYIAQALRRKGVVVVFFCHNVVEHESTAWKTGPAALLAGEGARSGGA